jgi:phage repressor protein C with HTH and peptisase S24 domain
VTDSFSVIGKSMYPILNDGDKVVCKKSSNLAKGDLVVLNTENYGRIIKKIKWINKKECRVEGSNPKCHSSACDFNHDVSKIIGKVIKIIR